MDNAGMKIFPSINNHQRPAIAACLFALGLALLAPPAEAKSRNGYVTQNLNLRAGPDEGYPPVKLIRERESVIISGCLDDLKWCEVQSGKDSGWVSAYYLRTYGGQKVVTIVESDERDSVRVIIYEPRNYWNRHYQDKPFYKDRDRWVKEDDKGKNNTGPASGKTPHNWSKNPRPQETEDKPSKEKAQPSLFDTMKKEKGYNPLCGMNDPNC